MRGLFTSGLGPNDYDSALETMHGHGVPIAGEMVSPHATCRTRTGKNPVSPLRPSFLRTYALTTDGHAGTRPSYAYSSRASAAGAARPRKFSDLVHVKIDDDDDDDAPTQGKFVYPSTASQSHFHACSLVKGIYDT